MAPSSAASLFVLAAAAAAQAPPPPPCANVSGLYAIGQEATEVVIWQRAGCSFTGMDNGGANVSGTVVGNDLNISLHFPDKPPETRYGLFDPSTSTINVTAPDGDPSTPGKLLRRIGCSRGFAGLWFAGETLLAISQNPTTCTGTMYSMLSEMPADVAFSQLSLTFDMGGDVVTGALTYPAMLTVGGAPPYKLMAPVPCFQSSDFALSPQCFGSLLEAAGNGTWMALGNALASRQSPISIEQARGHYCVSGPVAPAMGCNAPCTWQMDQGYSFCSCPDEDSCLASGFGWVSQAYPCDMSFAAGLMAASADCCGGGPDLCHVVGTPPVMYTQSPGGGQGPGCAALPTGVIRGIEAVSRMMVRRCGGGGGAPPPPSSSYMPPSPSYETPSPSYMPPSPSFEPPWP